MLLLLFATEALALPEHQNSKSSTHTCANIMPIIDAHEICEISVTQLVMLVIFNILRTTSRRCPLTIQR